MTKRQLTIENIRVCAYEGDEKGAMRLYCEHRNIGFDAYQKACQLGRQQREKKQAVSA